MLDIIGYTTVIGICLSLLFLMYYLVKATTDDSDNYKFLKDIVAVLFMNQRTSDEQDTEPKSKTNLTLAPFEEECPACQAKVTHNDHHCPACGLKIMD